jgi:hypothetical protein
MTTQAMKDQDHKMIGAAHSYTMRMTELAKTIMSLHPTSPNRVDAINDYMYFRTAARICRDAIVCREKRKLANFFLRTAGKPVDNAGNPIIS